MSGWMEVEAGIAASWKSLREELANHAERPRATTELRTWVDVEDDAAGVLVRLDRAGQDVVVSVSGNDDLAPWARWSRTQLEALRGLGLSRAAGRGPYTRRLDVRHVDEAADLVVRVWRDLSGVIDPSFLALRAKLGDTVVSQGEPVREQPPAPLAEHVSDRDDLCRLIGAELERQLHTAPCLDDDGDLGFPLGDSYAFVRIQSSVPVYQVLTYLAVDVQHHKAARRLVRRLNEHYAFVKFTLTHGQVLASVHMSAWPFAAQHLELAVDQLKQCLDRDSEDVLRLAGGRRFGIGRPAARDDG